MDECGIELVLVLDDDLIDGFGNEGCLEIGFEVNVLVQCSNGFRKGFGGHFVQVGDGDSCGEDGTVGVLGCE